MNLNRVLVEFTNEGRYRVFKSLYHEEKRHSQLERELKIPGPEISRHLRRLYKKGLIYKEGNVYSISGIGKIFYKILKTFEMALNYQEFFNIHDVDALPIQFIVQIGKLKNLKFGNQTMNNVQIWADLVKNSEKFIMAISDQFQESIIPIIEKKSKNELFEVKTLIEQKILLNSVKVGKIFKDRHAFYNKINAFKNVRVLNKVALSLLVSDKGGILFLSKKDKIDYSQCLFDSSELFINWLKQLFRWYWEKGHDLESFIQS
ncbi:MAG: ArsR family transcriptional regulator [Promethearchaeota archaeon]